MLKRFMIAATFVGAVAIGSMDSCAQAQGWGYSGVGVYPRGGYGTAYAVSPGREFRGGGQHPRSLNYGRIIPNTPLYPGNWRNGYGYGFGPSISVTIGY